MKKRTWYEIITLLIVIIIFETSALVTMRYSEVECHVDFEKLDTAVENGIPYLPDTMTVYQARLTYQQMRAIPLTQYYIEIQVDNIITCDRHWKFFMRGDAE